MKTMLIIGSLILSASLVQAKEVRKPSSSSRGELYLAEPMICHGKVRVQPKSMHSDYINISMRFVSFFSKRKDGTNANSLEISNVYKANSDDFSRASEVWYVSPLRKINKNVYHAELSGRGDELDLAIAKSEMKDGKRVDSLKGTWGSQGTVVGDYIYDLDCTATVVSAPSRVDDFTAK